jgi:hypothetical protein
VTYLLDTNAIIYYLQGQPELDTVFEHIRSGAASPMVSMITKIELLGYPRMTRNEEAKIRLLLQRFTVTGLSDEVADQAITLKRKYRLRTPDSIIAATAIVHDAVLVSRDDAHLGKVTEIRLLNPFRAGDRPKT